MKIKLTNIIGISLISLIIAFSALSSASAGYSGRAAMENNATGGGVIGGNTTGGGSTVYSYGPTEEQAAAIEECFRIKANDLEECRQNVRIGFKADTRGKMKYALLIEYKICKIEADINVMRCNMDTGYWPEDEVEWYLGTFIPMHYERIAYYKSKLPKPITGVHEDPAKTQRKERDPILDTSGSGTTYEEPAATPSLQDPIFNSSGGVMGY